ncbi:sodium:proton antiporter [Kordiimonas sediminis]|uniref:Sodium:proton antiporter n=1 Tax=Kordiimonas sediminis TaxID=1735581 RepID=A0A919AVX7_9PROT|nr:Na+/H+ antiporter NhaC family protein [Kordiimonas sediminis]GHF26133.1 sodium:proton antiporter [Kordiimonas sediminis]
MEDTTATYGILSILPTAIVLILAVLLRRPIEALLIGAVIGSIQVAGTGFIGEFTDMTLRTMQDEDFTWIVLVCGAMGSLIALLVRTGAMQTFIDFAANRIKSRSSSLMSTWALGIALFVDDYFNSMMVGATMRKITDKFKVSREMLAYVVDSTAAPVSVIIPISTWGVFFGGLLVDAELAAEGQGIALYAQSIPYMLYPIIAIILVPLVAKGIIPTIGPMKKAEDLALASGDEGVPVPHGEPNFVDTHTAIKRKEGTNVSILLFILPLFSLVGFTFFFDLDFLKAVYVTLALMCVYILSARILDHHDTFSTIIDGFKTMIEACAIIFAAYTLKDANDQLGLTVYILDATASFISAETLPMIVFAVMGFIAFATGSSWGVFVIAIPIIAELTRSTGANPSLIIGATLSASTFGSHACLYSDATVLTAQSCGTTPIKHALTQLPYGLLAASLSLVGFWLIA